MSGQAAFDQMVAFLKTMEGKTMSPRIKPPVGRPVKDKE